MKSNDDIDIDFVITWVNCNDISWQKERSKYRNPTNSDDTIIRYQDWDNLKYWFRAVETYAPWVRKVHLVTCGQVPSWLDTSSPKVALVRHSDYMPNAALPTFNSNAIEIGMQKINGLAEHFVYFCDDMFLTAPILPSYYFLNRLPKEMPGLTAHNESSKNMFNQIKNNDTNLVARHFDLKQVLSSQGSKWLRPSYGKAFFRTLIHAYGGTFPGFVVSHLSTPYTKNDFDRVWNEESLVLIETQLHKFRESSDVSHSVFKNWRMCTTEYEPEKSRGRYFTISGTDVAKKVAEAITEQKYPEICMNETCEGSVFEEVKQIVNGALKSTLKDKSSFEL